MTRETKVGFKSWPPLLQMLTILAIPMLTSAAMAVLPGLTVGSLLFTGFIAGSFLSVLYFAVWRKRL